MMLIKILVTVFSLGATSLSWSSETIRVAFGDALAPWVMPETHDGIVLDILTEALEPAGYEIVPSIILIYVELQNIKMDLWMLRVT